MNPINSIGQSSPIQKIVSQPVHKQLPTAPAKQVKLTDRVELSKVNHLLATLKTSDVRIDRVNVIRAQIAAGTYETQAKLDAAIERLMDDLGR